MFLQLENDRRSLVNLDKLLTSTEVYKAYVGVYKYPAIVFVDTYEHKTLEFVYSGSDNYRDADFEKIKAAIAEKTKLL